MTIIHWLQIISVLAWIGILCAAFLVGYFAYIVIQGDDHISKVRK
jgi:hypothetical protein